MLIIFSIMGVLFVLYLLRPYYEPFEISSAEFFETVEDSSFSLRFNIKSFVSSVPFWVQLLVFSSMLVAILLAAQQMPSEPIDTMGILYVLDTSASMSAQDGDTIRMETAKQEILAIREEITTRQEDFPNVAFCEELVSYDGNGVVIQSMTTLDQIQHRPLATAHSTLRLWLEAWLTSDSLPDNIRCNLTHVVVVSDEPAPEWVALLSEDVPIVWRDVGLPVDNAGIVTIQPRGSATFGWNGEIEVSVITYGTPPPATTLILEDTDGNIVDQRELVWSAPTTQTRVFQLSESGQYKIRLIPDDAYQYDNQATIIAEDFQNIRYSWELDTPMPFDLSRAGWIAVVDSPTIRVVASPEQLTGDIPTIIVGSAYRQADAIHSITYFEDDTGLLDRISLDAAEMLRIGQASIASTLDSSQYTPILTDDANHVLVATNDSVPFVYIPGPPIIDSDAELNSFSQTLFFNAVRWLLQEDAIDVELYRNTSTASPTPQGNINALHDGEGATHLDNVNFGDISDITPLAPPVTDNPLWALFVCAGMGIFVVERLLTLFGGHRWN
jgi:hypothetical protein